MARIAEDLYLLLLDNAAAQPALGPERRRRVLAGALLLDLAHACRIRPSGPGDPVQSGRLVALSGNDPLDHTLLPAFDLLSRRALRPRVAVSKLSKGAQDHLSTRLEGLGEIRRVQVSGNQSAWPFRSRQRVGPARAALLSALFDGTPPTPSTAAIVTLLHAADGLGALLSLNDRGWRWVHTRASEISSGSWVDESPTSLAEVNLAVTASVVRSALL